MVGPSVSDIINLIDSAIKLSHKIKDKDLNKILLELQETVLQYGNENLKLQEKYNKLKKEVEIPDNIYMDEDGFICRKGDKRKYCPHCWNKDRKLCLMPIKGIRNEYSEYSYVCAACKSFVLSNTAHF